MSRFEQTISLNGLHGEIALAAAYEAMLRLNWEVVLADGPALVGHTPQSWPSKGQQIRCVVTGNDMLVISETDNRELPDMRGLHKKNVAAFADVFAQVVTDMPGEALQQHLASIGELRNVAQQMAAQQRERYEELDKAMNLTGSNLNVTYGIIGINVLVFILMAINGAGVFEPNGLVHLRWGSNFAPLTLSGDWWRLLTSTFLHFGIIHLVMNMYCLYSIATYLEPMLGKQRYLAAYLSTGVIASLVSLWWHNEPANSAGASGAVFGLYGLFLAFLLAKYIPESIRQSLLRSIGIFVLFNLAYGMKSGVDNAAHVGGLVSGFLIGLAFVATLRKEKQTGVTIKWVWPLVVAVTVGLSAFYLQQHVVDVAVRSSLIKELDEQGYPDYTKFQLKLGEFDRLNKAASEAMDDANLTGTALQNKMEYEVMPKWRQAAELMKVTESYDISPKAHNKARLISEYITFRIQETELIKKMATDKPSNYEMEQRSLLRQKSDEVFRKLIMEK